MTEERERDKGERNIKNSFSMQVASQGEISIHWPVNSFCSSSSNLQFCEWLDIKVLAYPHD